MMTPFTQPRAHALRHHARYIAGLAMPFGQWSLPDQLGKCLWIDPRALDGADLQHAKLNVNHRELGRWPLASVQLRTMTLTLERDSLHLEATLAADREGETALAAIAAGGVSLSAGFNRRPTGERVTRISRVVEVSLTMSPRFSGTSVTAPNYSMVSRYINVQERERHALFS